MIADYADKLNTYENLKITLTWFSSLSKNRKENLQEGRYDPKKRHFCLGSEIYHQATGWCTDGIP